MVVAYWAFAPVFRDPSSYNGPDVPVASVCCHFIFSSTAINVNVKVDVIVAPNSIEFGAMVIPFPVVWISTPPSIYLSY